MVNQTVYPYKDTAVSIETRIEDLLSRMTLEEKIAQLGAGFIESFLENGIYSEEKLKEQIRKLGIGVLHNFFWKNIPDNELNMRTINDVQRYLVEKTRLGIPAIITGEGVHGHTSDGATIFPHGICISSSWDTELVGKVAAVIADESSAAGVRQLFSPVLDLAREPRWGRIQENYGEDPYLTARMGVAYIKGIQGESQCIDTHHVAATPKHFAAHGSPSGGINIGPVSAGERELRTVYLPPFKAAIREANALSIMNCYSELDGIPAAGNRKLLTGILREEWGFDGYVYSDWGSIEMLFTYHRTARNYAEAGKQALEAGVGVNAPDPRCYGKSLLDLVRKGSVSSGVVDEAVRRMLRVKFRLGLFEHPYADIKRAREIRNCSAHRMLARRAACESIVLLKNENNLLPLNKNIKSLAILGPNAATVRLGNYTGGGVEMVSLLDGIKNSIPNTTVRYAEGCGVYDLTTDAIQDAVTIAAQSEVAVLAVGESTDICEEGVDQHDLELPGVQKELIRAVYETGTPMVVVLMNGRPLAIKWVADHAPSILETWFAGEEQGNAIADILFGEVNPSGKLTVSLPQSTGHIPSFYNCKPSARGYYRKPGSPGKPGRDYVFATPDPLFEFGHGLSYTTFSYVNLTVAPDEIQPSGQVTVSVQVRNTGSRKGSEVVQLYVNDVVSSVVTPVKELKRFRKITLVPDEERTVAFQLDSEDLQIFDRNMNWIVEPGQFEVKISGLQNTFTVLPYSPGKEEIPKRFLQTED